MANLPNFFRNARVIGRGAFGLVYLATNTRENRRCAVKQIHCADPTAQSEIAALTRLGGHRSIVTFHDYEVYQNTVFLEMEYCEEGSLNTFYAKYRGSAVINPRLIFKFMKEVTSGLQYLHGIRVVHRDLKPDNILISPGNYGNYQAKITDFGLARVITDGLCNGQIHRFYMQSQVGTLYFMAPEILNGNYTINVDIFSMGIIFTSLIMGAWNDTGKLHLGIKHQGTPKPLGIIQQFDRSYEYELPANFPSSLRMKVLLLSMMAGDHHRRPSAGDVAQILDGMNDRDDVRASVPGANPYLGYVHPQTGQQGQLSWWEWITGSIIVAVILAIIYAVFK